MIDVAYTAICAVFVIVLHRILLWYPHLFWGVYHGGSRHGSHPDLLGQTLRKVKSIAHRGGFETTPENSLHSFRNAFQHLDMIELDVWLTKDNQIAVLHDGELERTTGVKGHINAFAYKDLPALLPTSMSTSNVHLRDLHIPLLEDVIREMSNKQFPMIVEVKQHSRQLVEMLDELLNRHKQLQGFVVWFSLDAGISNLLNEVNPQRPRIFSVKHVVLTYIFHYMGILPFIPTSWVGGSEAAVIFGFKVGDVGEGLLRKIPLLKTASVSMLTTVNRWVKGISVNASLVEHLRKRGIITYVLGVNNDEDFQNAVASTSEAFLTDRTEWMRAKLEENRVYCKKMS